MSMTSGPMGPVKGRDLVHHVIEPIQNFIASQNRQYETHIRRWRATGESRSERLAHLAKSNVFSLCESVKHLAQSRLGPIWRNP
jgi:hypothetical protein